VFDKNNARDELFATIQRCGRGTRCLIKITLGTSCLLPYNAVGEGRAIFILCAIYSRRGLKP
jgi:hypothetical protein